jgi:transcriptional regulator with XRE-family HTH domain
VGWTQSEIGEAIGLSQPTISERLSNLPNLVKLIKSLLDLQGEGLSVLGLVVERLS